MCVYVCVCVACVCVGVCVQVSWHVALTAYNINFGRVGLERDNEAANSSAYAIGASVSLSLSVCRSLYLSAFLSVCLSVCRCVCICLPALLQRACDRTDVIRNVLIVTVYIYIYICFGLLMHFLIAQSLNTPRQRWSKSRGEWLCTTPSQHNRCCLVEWLLWGIVWAHLCKIVCLFVYRMRTKHQWTVWSFVMPTS